LREETLYGFIIYKKNVTSLHVKTRIKKVRKLAMADKFETKVQIETEFKSELVPTGNQSFFIPEMEKLDKPLQSRN
jgi:hypothetical protein